MQVACILLYYIYIYIYDVEEDSLGSYNLPMNEQPCRFTIVVQLSTCLLTTPITGPYILLGQLLFNVAFYFLMLARYLSSKVGENGPWPSMLGSY